MARSVTVAQIITAVRRWTDYTTAEKGDTEILDYINEDWPRLYAIYVKAYPELFRTEVEVTSTGVASYALPADYFETIGVDWKQDANRYRRLRRLNEAERNRYSGVTSSPARAFRVLQSNLVLYPTPRAGEVYRHIYVPTAPVLSLGGTIDGLMGHEKLLGLEVAVRLAAAEGAEELPGLLLIYEPLKKEVEEEGAMRVAEASYPVDEYEMADADDEGSYLWSRP